MEGSIHECVDQHFVPKSFEFNAEEYVDVF